MLEAHEIVQGESLQTAMAIELGFDDRQKSRHKGVTQCGQEIGWFIARGHVLKDGDFLKCTSGELIRIVPAQEKVSSVYARSALDLTRAAYHLGNRHVPLQITENFLRYQHDHVLDEMVKGLGLQVDVESAPFQPEAGAYAAGHSSSHSHSHDSSQGKSHNFVLRQHNHTHNHDH
jgi:urease accessory protein